MDISLLTGQRTNAWSATMINLEARKLINTVNMVAANTVSREVNNQLLNKLDSQRFVADTAMSVAEFMGFRGETGRAAYKTGSLAANAYSVFGLLRKPGSWRLFYFMRSDYYRKMDSMSRPKLTMKIIGYGINARIVFDLLSIDNNPA